MIYGALSIALNEYCLEHHLPRDISAQDILDIHGDELTTTQREWLTTWLVLVDLT